MTKHFVKFFTPGLIHSTTYAREIENRETSFDIFEEVYAYQFYDIEEVIINGETLKGEPKNHSPMYYYGEEWDLNDAIKNTGHDSTLVRNMKDNEWNRVVSTPCGCCYQLFDGDKVLTHSP